MPNDAAPATPSFADAVTTCYKLREQIDEIDAAQKQQMQPYEESLKSWEALVLKFLLESGQHSGNVDGVGTVYQKEFESITVQDWNATWAYMQTSGNYDLLEHKVNKTAARAYMDKMKTVVPGTSYSCIVKVGYNKARAKA